VLHPELQTMFSRYNELVDAAEQGLISVEEAMTTLSSMVVVDAAGVEWRLDANGQIYSSLPGAQPMPADPKMFTPSSSITGIPMPWSPSRTSPNDSSSMYAPPSIPVYDQPSPYGAPPVGVVPHPVIPNSKRALPKISVKKGRIRTLLVVVVSIVVAFFLINAQGGKEPVVIEAPIITETEEELVGKTDITIREAKKVVAVLSGTQSAAALEVTRGNDLEMLEIAMPFAAASRLGYELEVTDVFQNKGGGTSALVIIKFGDELITTWSLQLEKINNKVFAVGNEIRR